MATNKVIYQGNVIMDVTDSTVTPETLNEGVVAYAANGERIVGTGAMGGIVDVYELPTEDINEAAIYRLADDFYTYKNGWTKHIFATEKPFDIDIQWDGDMAGHDTFDLGDGSYYVKVSNEVYTKEQLLGATIYYSDDYSEVIQEDTFTTVPGAFFAGEIIIAYSAEELIAAEGLPEDSISNGVWFYYNEEFYTTGLLGTTTKISKISAEYLDVESLSLATVATSGSWNDLEDKPICAAHIEEIIGTATISRDSGTESVVQIDLSTPLVEQGMYLVKLDNGTQIFKGEYFVKEVADNPSQNFYMVVWTKHSGFNFVIEKASKSHITLSFNRNVPAGTWTIEIYRLSSFTTLLSEELLPESIEGVVIRSSTEGSTKKFKITVDDSGTISATEVIE